MTDAPEFSRRFPLAEIGTVPKHVEIVADETECAAVARRFGSLTPPEHLLAASAALVAAPALRAQAPTRIVFGYTAVTDFASAFVAAEQGYFKKRGLDVEMKFIPLNSTIPAALQDRMEVIRLSGYTEVEKMEIAKRFLVPKQLTQSGLDKDSIEFQDNGIQELVQHYTREAGVRNLEREVGNVCRKIARKIVVARTKKETLPKAVIKPAFIRISADQMTLFKKS